MINSVVEKIISCQVLKKFKNSLELTSRLSRLQCSKCSFERPLVRNYYWILDFQYLFSFFIFQNPKNSAINVGPVECETNLT